MGGAAFLEGGGGLLYEYDDHYGGCLERELGGGGGGALRCVVGEGALGTAGTGLPLESPCSFINFATNLAVFLSCN